MSDLLWLPRVRVALRRLFFLITMFHIAAATAASAPQKKESRLAGGHFVRASEAGAALNADLMKGGGSDDTDALQAVLNRAAKGRPIHLLIDGMAMVRGLNIYGNTTIECVKGGGLHLKAGSSRSIIRNAHRSRDSVTDEHIAIRGCFLHGNRAHQPGARPELEPHTNNQSADRTFISGIELMGVNYADVENVTVFNARSFGVFFANATRINIRNVIVDHGGGPDVDHDYLQTDGVRFVGPIQYVTIDGLKLRTGDDGLAFNADDAAPSGDSIDSTRDSFGPYVGSGPITDVNVSNVQFMDALWGIRFLSTKSRIDRVMISNVVGKFNGPRFLVMSNWTSPEPGNIGSIELNNINVDRSPDARFVARYTELFKSLKANWPAYYDEDNGGVGVFFNINAQVENLTIRDFKTKVMDSRPIFRIGPSAKVQQMTLSASLFDPKLQAVPFELDKDGRVEQLNFALDWRGREASVARNPIEDNGGSIGELRWVDTPPRFVEAKLAGRNLIIASFSQVVKGKDYGAGVRIEVSGAFVKILRAARDSTQPDSVRYTIDKAIGSKDSVSWAYQAAEGMIQNMNGEHLLSVSAKPVSGAAVFGGP